MSDLTEQLRVRTRTVMDGSGTREIPDALCIKAAKEIERLRRLLRRKETPNE